MELKKDPPTFPFINPQEPFAAALLGTWFGWRILALNILMIWPLFDMNYGMATGSWAVGCEVVFYALFCLWAIAGFPVWALAIAGSASYGLGQWMLAPDVLLTAQWTAWINPLVQLLPFASGCAMGLVKKRWDLGWSVGLGLCLGLCLALPTPIAVYWFRPILIAAGCLMVAHARDWEPLARMGKYSYQIYLIHPVIWHLFFRL